MNVLLIFVLQLVAVVVVKLALGILFMDPVGLGNVTDMVTRVPDRILPAARMEEEEEELVLLPAEI
ncbi:hypothetical protein A3G67_00650 [Candidatus Roizmanbacteria bacterium RIFCSPLOWO2_12_FULL_40_12]|uniref:Uncharacterized protein n=1 Tax=Candidatus Roizmanbacteria bacterium RIFCSPLOWO2_01_FULL_40_42 TaxID=1802066 RepID=A0A1F7J6A7_9BACT|nr:MAG: hypothetical protein A2779_02130 [Candidatus Roizmanbacteria bacterium RIFCSPHIGHO2_01_FULL_40_98]OGK28788.1 MAG: hypothetical protein A3C31_04050 [Candidatus Roizmanbacteria bacterium RIFCSPHIGHO2_02_FULL_40_53]OGK29646.1 MAG: hypothetical protein A2W49_00445 [Candidatus Roizmanbacteria bacterium RIFCSPHIGHO2_12_41_18]OGK36319.1 MAG: hypothetical protein A3E69_02735 [Candidatus Roizmanbacteria bacterium RIFCSPHIGHO2_12_FULL_40_130]OGK51129.1 MAG: hypothetical protein A3B50_05025 [Candi